MRVPEISLTAGYAATYTQVSNYGASAGSCAQLGAGADRRPLVQQEGSKCFVERNYCPYKPYSANEFVDRALNSTNTVEYVAHLERLPSSSSGVGDGGGTKRSNVRLPSTGGVLSAEKAIGCRAYGRLNDVCNRNAPDGNEIEHIEHSVGNSATASSAHVKDPIAKCHIQDNIDSTAMKTDAAMADTQTNSAATTLTAGSAQSIGFCDIRSDALNENDEDDPSLADFGYRSTRKLPYSGDDRDEYFTSPTSSTMSLRLPKHTYFPRGIINPNYPGFQHLAHTLSEHFLGSTRSDSYDSDMSEYEMELSSDSFEDLPEEQTQLDAKLNYYNNNNNNNSNNNNSNDNNNSQNASNVNNNGRSTKDEGKNITINKSNSLEKAMDTGKVKGSFLELIDKQYGEDFAVTGPVTTFNDTNRKGQNIVSVEIALNDVPDETLDTALTLLEPTKEMVARSNAAKQAEVEAESGIPIDCTEKSSPAIEKFIGGSMTPDILVKNFNLSVERLSIKENRPDLLRGVSPHFRNMRATECADEYGTAEQEVKRIAAPCISLAVAGSIASGINSRNATNEINKDEISLGITPVDIIGDFGQEVEREFGLLVSGYKRLVDSREQLKDNHRTGSEQTEKITDVMLSTAKDQIDSHRLLAALSQIKRDLNRELEDSLQINVAQNLPAVAEIPVPRVDERADFVAPKVGGNLRSITTITAGQCCDANSSLSPQGNQNKTNNLSEEGTGSGGLQKVNYKKASYDERQLPPVVIEYKSSQQGHRNTRKTTNNNHSERNAKGPIKTSRGHLQPNSGSNKSGRTKRNHGGSSGSGLSADKHEMHLSRQRQEAELHQYQQLISDKELILSNSRYAKLSSWAQYLKNSVKDGSANTPTDLISPSALDLFEAYKIGTEIDMETLQKHLKLAKEIERKRRSDREEIRRRLAMGVEENCNVVNERSIWKPNIESRIQDGFSFCRANEPSSDTESHSSDSETCPKLSKTSRSHGNTNGNLHTHNVSISLRDKSHPCNGNGRPFAANCSGNNNNNNSNNSNNHSNNNKQHPGGKPHKKHQQKLQQEKLLTIHNTEVHRSKEKEMVGQEPEESDFFTKQAKLQIEARMALAQAKEMAHMQMEIERQNQRISPVTEIIRSALEKIGVYLSSDKRRVSRQMLTEMNIAQLQILVNNLHTHIENLNESLMHFLMERDDLHIGQDGMLVDIEELTRYIGAKEHLLQQERNSRLTTPLK